MARDILGSGRFLQTKFMEKANKYFLITLCLKAIGSILSLWAKESWCMSMVRFMKATGTRASAMDSEN